MGALNYPILRGLTRFNFNILPIHVRSLGEKIENGVN